VREDPYEKLAARAKQQKELIERQAAMGIEQQPSFVPPPDLQ